MKTLLVATISVALCVAQSTPLPQDEPAPTLRSSSRLVLLDVVVLDSSGKPVTGLSRDDFTVLEDGKPQKIDSFERPEEHKYAVSIADNLETQPIQAVAPALTILVIDGLNTPLLDTIFAREMVTKFLRNHGPKLAQPTALMRVTDRQLELVHDYTQDSATLLDALKKHPPELPFRYGADPDIVGSADRLMDTLSCLEKIAAANANFAGRKNLIWIGQGFPAINDTIRPGNKKIMASVANDMRNARLAVYTIDPRGLQVTSPSVGGYNDAVGGLQMITPDLPDDPSGLRFFEDIARESGGRMIFNRNDVDVAVADSVNDGASYYTLAYYPANRDWNGKFRAIKVRLAKQGLVARTRAGYFAIPDGLDTDATVDSVLYGALRSPLPYKGLAIRASFRSLPNRPGMARFDVAVDRHDLDWRKTPNGDYLCHVMLVAMSVSRKERIVKNDIKELQGIVKASNWEAQREKPMTFPFIAELPPTADTMRVVVRDAGNGRVGTADLVVRQSAVARATTN